MKKLLTASQILLFGLAAEAWVDYGIGIDAAELRHSAAFIDAAEQPFIIGATLDKGKPYLLVTDALNGKTEQYYMPDGVTGDAFGAALTGGGKYIIGMSEVLIFDVNTREYTRAGAGYGANLCAGIAPDGTVYLGSAPHSVMIAVDPDAGTSKNLGRMDDGEDYLSSIAVDKEGFVYCGIGTARANIVAYDPVSGNRTQLLPEELRALGSGLVVTGEDGCVYASFGDFNVKCLGGRIVEEGDAPEAKSDSTISAEGSKSTAGHRTAANQVTLKYGTHLREFGNGMRVIEYDLNTRKMTVEHKDGSQKTYDIDYVSGGLELSSMARGADGLPYFSSAHPHHLGRIDTASGEIIDLGYNCIVEGGNFCNMVAFNGKLYGCEYAGGRLWEYSHDKPYQVSAEQGTENNPKVLGQWEELITRPRAIAVHPDGKEVVMGGFAGYGLAGGGLGIHNLETGENRTVSEILPGESCIAIDFMPDGNLLGGTSADAPGGGHMTAEYGSVFIMDWESGKVIKNAKVEALHVIDVAFRNGLIYAASDHLYIFDPSDMSLVNKIDISEAGWVVRNAFQETADGRLLLVTEKMLYTVEKDGLKKLAPAEKRITSAGPVIDGRLYFIHDLTNVGSVELP